MVSRVQIGSSVTGIVLFALVTAYWMVTPQPESVWIPILFAAIFGIIAFQEWRKGRAKTSEDHEASKTNDPGRS